MQTGFESNLPFPGPTQEIPPPMFNLAAIPGTYQIDNVTFYGKTVQLNFKFRSDFSATMETKFEDGEVYTASGTWKPGDIFFDVSLVDQFQEPMKFNIYVAGPAADDLTISNVASAYSFDNIPDATLINVSNGAPAPTITPVATDTPAQTSQPRPTNTFEPSRTPPPTFPPLPTKTSRPTQTIQPTANSAVPASAPKAASPICGSAILLPLLGAIWLSWKRRTAW